MTDLVDRLKTVEKEVEKARVTQLLAGGASMVSTAPDVSGIAVVAQRIDGAAAGDVRTLAMDVRSKLDRPGAVLIAGVKDGKVAVVAAVNDEARERGVSANDLVRLVGTFIDGKGGGKDDVAQGGGTDTGRLDEALTAVLTEVAREAGA